jgi:Icc-related predicted phosphoesterase
MKILTISDVVHDLVHSPNIAERFKDIDLVLSCGDLPFDYLEYIVTMLGKRLCYVYGNHAQREVLQSDGERIVEPRGCENIHRRVIEHKGVLIAGLEGSLRYRDGPHQYTQAQNILITHAAPAGIQDGKDLCHRGFRAFLGFMGRYKPRYLIHGHTHLYRQDANRTTQYGDTIVLNTCGYQVIEIDETTLDPRTQDS